MKVTSAVAIASTVITAAASYSTALAGSLSDSRLGASSQDSASRSKQEEEQQQQSGDGFAPRFDGLRFIETLITAHR
ncbi:hypothetical protein OPV22_019197 [Ensete ventricosum]|uniref:Uncharacterized protein n=1 Tax=Ensete ventricosum TaxID=4639 RepID=A0AAV8R200_ENSVE|nr:hypothetical protein OPV22_019197 [Ensete ventricosum]RZR91034.1 hypothetical protein BHM03_00019079 [Ensete ventricosum]